MTAGTGVKKLEDVRLNAGEYFGERALLTDEPRCGASHLPAPRAALRNCLPASLNSLVLRPLPSAAELRMWSPTVR